MSYEWVEAANYTTGRRTPLTFIVWHSAECPLQAGYAHNVAVNYFAQPATQTSAHVIVDPIAVVEMVKPRDEAWHCGNGNQGGYGIEMCGRSGFTRADWTTAVGMAELKLGAEWAAGIMRAFGIPARWLTDAQLARREPGMCTHADVTRVLGGTTHTDPGPNWPRDLALPLVAAALNGVASTVPLPEEDLDMQWPYKLYKVNEDAKPDIYKVAPGSVSKIGSEARWASLTDAGLVPPADQVQHVPQGQLDDILAECAAPAVDVDEHALAAELAPLLGGVPVEQVKAAVAEALAKLKATTTLTAQ